MRSRWLVRGQLNDDGLMLVQRRHMNLGRQSPARAAQCRITRVFWRASSMLMRPHGGRIHEQCLGFLEGPLLQAGPGALPDSGGEGAGMEVVVMDEGVDALDELFNGGEGAAPDRLLGNVAEPALDLIEPGRGGGREVDVVARTLGEPSANLRVLVGGVVVDDQMQLQRCRHAVVQMAQEGEKLLVTVAGFTLGDDLTAAHLERSEQRRRAVPVIVVHDALHIAQPHR